MTHEDHVIPFPLFTQELKQEKRITIILRREEIEGQAFSMLCQKDLLDYFSSYGKIERLNWIRDRATNAVKGYGFITFYDKGSFEEAVKRKHHMLNGRRGDVFPASQREKTSAAQKRMILVKLQKGFVAEMTVKSVHDYFSAFGEVEHKSQRTCESTSDIFK